MRKSILIWLTFASLISLIWFGVHVNDIVQSMTKNLTYSDFLKLSQEGNIKRVKFLLGDVGEKSSRVEGEFLTPVDGKVSFVANIPFPSQEDIDKFIQEVQAKNPSVQVDIDREVKTNWPNIVMNFAIWGAMIGFLVVFIYSQRQAMGKAMNFGKTKVNFFANVKERFTDVAGIEEAKAEVVEIVDFLKVPQRFAKIGANMPKGVLLIGPPGCGKTLLARAIAGEAGASFTATSGSEFVEMFVGVGARRVRDLFEQAKKNVPCIIFIDELDAVGRHRGTGLGGGHDEREQTLNQILVEMDGFEQTLGIVVLAATNRPDVLDPALLRPGRFTRKVVVSRPDVKGRHEILKIHAKKYQFDENIELNIIARGTPGFTGDDLQNLLNEAAIYAVRDHRHTITMADLERAKDKVLMGEERRSAVITAQDKELTAYHESGHTLVGLLLANEGADPVHKVTIIPRGMALGVTQQLPEKDHHTYSKQQVETRIAVCMGGRVAEAYKFGPEKITTGAQNDIDQATDLAIRMVCEWGMSSLGPVRLGKDTEHPYLGLKMAQREKDYSEDTGKKIDNAVKHIVESAQIRARNLIEHNSEKLELIARSLIERETLDAADLKRIMKIQKS